jgi:hypothetical protein
MNRPKTRSAPKARTERAATTLLSIPPDNPTTTPLRLSCLNTCSRIALLIRSASRHESSFSWSAENGIGPFI